MCMADDNVGDVVRLDSCGLHRLVRAKVVLHRKLFEKCVAVKSAVEEDGSVPSANQPYHHRDVDLLVFWAAHNEFCHRYVRRGGVANRLNRILRCLSIGWRTEHERAENCE